MHVKDFIEQLKNYPTDDNGKIIYIFPVDIDETASCIENANDVLFNKHSTAKPFIF